MSRQKPITYKDAGVDIDAGNRFVDMIKPLVKQTSRPEVLTDIGGFGGLFRLNSNKYKRPTLVSSTDGVGTKLKLAFMMDKHDTVGIDLVAMCVNDIIVQGAEPLFFLDYLATGKLTPEKAVEIVKGISEGCKQSNCALLGGETAEMPGMYSDGEYDLAGFTVGVVDNAEIIDGSTITKGDQIIGIASSGLHSNGYSLARKVFLEAMKLDLNDKPNDLERTLGEELLTPTRIYVKTILNLMRDFTIKGVAHITGGGLLENLPRVLPQKCKAIVDRNSWEKPAIFEMLREGGSIPETEMYRTFNYGIGMAIIAPENEVEDIVGRLSGLNEKAYLIGEIAQATEPSVELY
ncbi:phosphoribosylformylglycinamidine cyclo-ligase [Malonomonas rubra]|uniref:phosphoribosylformylglycinamidine cyclo-ligase n=1 Tax=Malonomonas rubra TaxID=57040 RepID=UPI0026F25E53|nr:phosphoribosylformylglycinamidine cyclo-ligase [Malonomonas rubra]